MSHSLILCEVCPWGKETAQSTKQQRNQMSALGRN